MRDQIFEQNLIASEITECFISENPGTAHIIFKGTG